MYNVGTVGCMQDEAIKAQRARAAHARAPPAPAPMETSAGLLHREKLVWA